jgi:hypothetical protein
MCNITSERIASGNGTPAHGSDSVLQGTIVRGYRSANPSNTALCGWQLTRFWVCACVAGSSVWLREHETQVDADHSKNEGGQSEEISARQQPSGAPCDGGSQRKHSVKDDDM